MQNFITIRLPSFAPPQKNIRKCAASDSASFWFFLLPTASVCSRHMPGEIPPEILNPPEIIVMRDCNSSLGWMLKDKYADKSACFFNFFRMRAQKTLFRAEAGPAVLRWSTGELQRCADCECIRPRMPLRSYFQYQLSNLLGLHSEHLFIWKSRSSQLGFGQSSLQAFGSMQVVWVCRRRTKADIENSCEAAFVDGCIRNPHTSPVQDDSLEEPYEHPNLQLCGPLLSNRENQINLFSLQLRWRFILCRKVVIYRQNNNTS